jgi:hypothetical protein
MEKIEEIWNEVEKKFRHFRPVSGWPLGITEAPG